ncbi:hypothetical protein V2S66_17090 [Streptomyces sp. V4-01]|uniref:Uncharacterized protein n=1 Tax=Actinacidiphila polyblastidii TaxID=3110430 RepID=A0ABU7PCZ9_9ACTN|nr:hypothetical protein [Streptomyces sp. V4-01]
MDRGAQRAVDYWALRSHLPAWEPAGVLDTLRLARAARTGLASYRLGSLVDEMRLDMGGIPDGLHGAR